MGVFPFHYIYFYYTRCSTYMTESILHGFIDFVLRSLVCMVLNYACIWSVHNPYYQLKKSVVEGKALAPNTRKLLPYTHSWDFQTKDVQWHGWLSVTSQKKFVYLPKSKENWAVLYLSSAACKSQAPRVQRILQTCTEIYLNKDENIHK